jgi:signal transduction histidine kinase
MWIHRPKSLRKLLLIHEVAFLFLVAVTGLLGGLSAYFWHQYSAESNRINNLIFGTEQIRGELFRQIQEAIRARLLEDAQALELYGEYSRSIDQQFNKLRQNANSTEEDKAIQDLQSSYREIQKDMNKIFTDPYVVSRQVRMKILDPRFSQAMVGRFEVEYLAMKSILKDEHEAMDIILDRWTRYAPIIIPIPLLLAVMLVLYARNILNREFILPMSSVISGANIISRGQLDFKLSVNGVEEVSELANTINSMASELEDSRYALVESEKQTALGALVPVVAHNIRNPLASIRATAQVLEDIEDKEELKESKQAILETIDRLGRWVNALVSYLHPLKPNYRLIHASKMINATLHLLKPKLDEKLIRINKIGWENDLRLNADPDLMEQAFYALLANAIDASPREAFLTISMTTRDSNLEICFQDQGPGLPFNPKPNNLAPGPTTKRFGTGLGIPIAFKICQQHGWKLEFEDNDGPGTTAIIIAPIRVIEESDNETTI